VRVNIKTIFQTLEHFRLKYGRVIGVIGKIVSVRNNNLFSFCIIFEWKSRCTEAFCHVYFVYSPSCVRICTEKFKRFTHKSDTLFCSYGRVEFIV